MLNFLSTSFSEEYELVENIRTCMNMWWQALGDQTRKKTVGPPDTWPCMMKIDIRDIEAQFALLPEHVGLEACGVKQ